MNHIRYSTVEPQPGLNHGTFTFGPGEKTNLPTQAQDRRLRYKEPREPINLIVRPTQNAGRGVKSPAFFTFFPVFESPRSAGAPTRGPETIYDVRLVNTYINRGLTLGPETNGALSRGYLTLPRGCVTH